MRHKLTGLLLILLLAGCGLQATPPEPVTINFAIGEHEAEAYQPLLTAFAKKYPEITVELQEMGRDQDTDCFAAEPFDLPQDVAGGELLALDPFFEQDAEFKAGDFYPGTVDVLSYEGKKWGIPAGIDPFVLYSNTRLFDGAGAPYPAPGWTWDDFLTAGLAISKPDERVFGYAMPQSVDAFDAALFVYQHGGRLFDDINAPTAVTLDDPKTIEAVQWYTDLALRHNIAPTPEQARGFSGGNQGIWRGVYEGKFGMWLGTFADRGGRTWPVEWQEPWGMAPLPRDEVAATAGIVQGYFLAADRPHPEACWKWVTFLSEQTAPGLAPARRTLAESAAFEQEVGAEAAETVRASIESAFLISPEAVQAGEVLGAFGSAVRQVLTGTVTAEEAMQLAQEQVEGILP